jgi:hypothetical protein
MFKAPEMKVSDYTCLLCGSKLGLTLKSAKIGDNSGCCPMCGEHFIIDITADEMRVFREIEEKNSRVH